MNVENYLTFAKSFSEKLKQREGERILPVGERLPTARGPRFLKGHHAKRLVYRYVDSVFIKLGRILYCPRRCGPISIATGRRMMRAGEPCTNGRIYA
jgi:hypothetical protein